MSLTNYQKRLLDPRWQKKRLEIMSDRGFRCEKCQNDSAALHVHHRYYVSGRQPWEYPYFCYLVLCESCHDVEKDDNLENVGHGEFVFLENVIESIGWEAFMRDVRDQYSVPEEAM